MFELSHGMKGSNLPRAAIILAEHLFDHLVGAGQEHRRHIEPSAFAALRRRKNRQSRTRPPCAHTTQRAFFWTALMRVSPPCFLQ
jgi:hypothetical protein